MSLCPWLRNFKALAAEVSRDRRENVTYVCLPDFFFALCVSAVNLFGSGSSGLGIGDLGIQELGEPPAKCPGS